MVEKRFTLPVSRPVALRKLESWRSGSNTSYLNQWSSGILTIAHEAILPHHVVQIIVLVFCFSVDLKRQLSQETGEFVLMLFPRIHYLDQSHQTHKQSLTDFSLDTLEARLSARRRFSASSISSTVLPEQHRNHQKGSKTVSPSYNRILISVLRIKSELGATRSFIVRVSRLCRRVSWVSLMANLPFIWYLAC